MEAIAFERDIDEYEIHIAVINTILSGQRRVSVVLSKQKKAWYIFNKKFGFVKI